VEVEYLEIDSFKTIQAQVTLGRLDINSLRPLNWTISLVLKKRKVVILSLYHFAWSLNSICRQFEEEIKLIIRSFIYLLIANGPMFFFIALIQYLYIHKLLKIYSYINLCMAVYTPQSANHGSRI